MYSSVAVNEYDEAGRFAHMLINLSKGDNFFEA